MKIGAPSVEILEHLYRRVKVVVTRLVIVV